MAPPSETSQYQHALMQWLNLANRRLEYLTELHESGRYRKYYSEKQFAQVLSDSRASVDTWRRLAAGGWQQGVVLALRKDDDELVNRTMALIASPFEDLGRRDGQRSVA